jgi:hypothetical protein
MDLLRWLICYEQFFRGQQTSNAEKIGYVTFHLTGAGKLRYRRLTKNIVVTDGEHFAHCINEYFSFPTQGDPLDEQ